MIDIKTLKTHSIEIRKNIIIIKIIRDNKLLFLGLSFGFFFLLFFVVRLFTLFSNKFTSNSLNNFNFILSKFLDSRGKSLVLLN